MTAVRDEILARIRAANGPAIPGAEVDAAYAVIPRGYRRAHHDPASDIVALFTERAADYRAVVERVSPDDVPAAIVRAITPLRVHLARARRTPGGVARQTAGLRDGRP